MQTQRILAVLISLLVVGERATAQEALRGAVNTDTALAARPRASSFTPGSGLTWGPVRFSVGASLSVEYDDNIRSSATAPLDDVIVRPRLDFGVLWPVTERSSLSASFGVGYAHYFDNDQFDYFEITPTSALAYSISYKDVVLTVYDRVSYTGDVLDQPELSGVARYPRLENTVGLRVAWSVEDWLFEGGYAHFNYWAFDEAYEYLDRASEQFLARASYSVADRTRVGIESTVSLTAYDLPVRNDYQTFSAGPFVEWAVVDSLSVSARGGYVIHTFDQTGLTLSPGDRSTYYAGLSLRHALTEFISHTLSAVRDASSGIGSQYIERFGLSYGIGWQMTDVWDVSLGAGYDRGEEKSQLGTGETYDRVSWRVGVGCRVTERVRAALYYRGFTRFSNFATREYDRNVVGASVSYRF
jgi:hypothetical protein